MQVPDVPTFVALVLVAAGLVAVHLAATQGTGVLDGHALATASITPATTLSHWWHHLWAGFFHKSWLHLGYNLAVLAVALPFAARDGGPWLSLANAFWIGPLTVLVLHLVLVLPLASAGLPYAVRALDLPLVGFSVMAYSIAGMALTRAPPRVGLGVAAAVAVFEAVLSARVTGPFIAVYHVAGLGMGYWVRTLLLRA